MLRFFLMTHNNIAGQKFGVSEGSILLQPAGEQVERCKRARLLLCGGVAGDGRDASLAGVLHKRSALRCLLWPVYTDDSSTSFFVTSRTLLGSRRFYNGIRGTP